MHDHLGEVYEKTGNLKMAVAQWERSMTEYAHSLPADADPEDVQKVQHKLENARVKLAKLTRPAQRRQGSPSSASSGVCARDNRYQRIAGLASYT